MCRIFLARFELALIAAPTIGYQLLDEPDKTARIGLSALPFLADLGRHSPDLLPSTDRPGERYLNKNIALTCRLMFCRASWTPTMSFHIEFKVKLSALPSYIAPQTFGVWSTGRFIVEGRHEVLSGISQTVQCP